MLLVKNTVAMEGHDLRGHYDQPRGIDFIVYSYGCLTDRFTPSTFYGIGILQLMSILKQFWTTFHHITERYHMISIRCVFQIVCSDINCDSCYHNDMYIIRYECS